MAVHSTRCDETRTTNNTVNAEKLNATNSMGGTVQTQTGQPVSGAIVHLWGTERDIVGQVVETMLSSTSTDVKGQWKLTEIPANQKFLTIQIDHREYLPIKCEVAENPSVHDISQQDLLAEKAAIKLEPGFRVEGIVRNAWNRPLNKADIALFYGNNFDTQLLGKTDAQGHFILIVQKSGQGRLRVEANGYSPQDKFITIERGFQPLEFSLSLGFRTYQGRLRFTVVCEVILAILISCLLIALIRFLYKRYKNG